MIIMRIFGGMASQIDKYILGREVADYLGTELCLDIHDYVDGYFRPFILEYFTLPNEKLCLIHPVKAYGRKIKLIGTGEELIKACENYNDEILYLYRESKDYEAFCDKFPQMRRNDKNPYFKTIRPKLEYEGIKSFKEKIKDNFSIAVQIRRGDFVDLGWEDDIESYKGAIGHLLQDHKDAHFYIFSNDLEYCRQHLGTSQYLTYVQNSIGTVGDIEDFCCIAMCDMVVISSFSGYARTAACIGAQQGGKCRVVALKEAGELPENVIILTEDQISNGISSYENDASALYDEKNNACKFQKKNDYYSLIGRKIVDVRARYIVVVTSDAFSRTNVRYGLEEMARILAHIDKKVLFVSVEQGKEEPLTEADDWDGKSLGYERITISKRSDIDKVLQKWLGTTSNEDVMILSCIKLITDYKYIYLHRHLDISRNYGVKAKLSTIKRFLLKNYQIYIDKHFTYSPWLEKIDWRDDIDLDIEREYRLDEISNEIRIYESIEDGIVIELQNIKI